MNADQLRALPGNAVVYSEKAWAAARRASDGHDRWFADDSAWRNQDVVLTSERLAEWVDDWVHMVPVVDL